MFRLYARNGRSTELCLAQEDINEIKEKEAREMG